MIPTPPAPKPVEILLIEDNPGDARLLREVLAEGTFAKSLHVVSDGQQALDFAHGRNAYEGRTPPDLILLDLNLPRRDGWEVLAELKSDESLRRIPVLVLTSSKARGDILRSDALHANGYISKPSDLSQFSGMVRSIEEFWISMVRPPNPQPPRDLARAERSNDPTVPP